MTNTKKIYPLTRGLTPTPPACYEAGKTSRPEVIVCRFAFALDARCATCEWMRRLEISA